MSKALILIAGGVAAVGAGVAAGLPEIKRYLKIRQM